MGEVIPGWNGDGVFTGREILTSHKEDILLALTLLRCYTKQELLVAMNWKLVKLLLSTSFLISAFGPHNEVNAEINVDIDTVTEAYGAIRFDKSFPSLHSYAMSRNNKAEFAVAIMTPNQIKDNKTGILFPSVLWVDCKNGLVQFNSMEKLPVKDKKRVVAEAVQFQGARFCQFHKQVFKHSRW